MQAKTTVYQKIKVTSAGKDQKKGRPVHWWQSEWYRCLRVSTAVITPGAKATWNWKGFISLTGHTPITEERQGKNWSRGQEEAPLNWLDHYGFNGCFHI